MSNPSEEAIKAAEKIIDRFAKDIRQIMQFAKPHEGEALAVQKFRECANKLLESYRQASQAISDEPYSLTDILSTLVKATEILLHKKNYDGGDYEEMEMCVKRAKVFLRERLSSPPKNNGWISVEERLPELTEPLMGYNDDGVREVFVDNFKATVWGYHPEYGTFKAERTKRGWSEISTISTNSTFSPTHWMPLPEAPRLDALTHPPLTDKNQ